MSAKLTLTIDEKVIARAKEYAREHGRSLSNLIENYLQSLLEEPEAAGYDTPYSPLVRSLKGAIRVGDKDVDYKEMLEDELLKKYLG
jgi:hypothetical protein